MQTKDDKKNNKQQYRKPVTPQIEIDDEDEIPELDDAFWNKAVLGSPLKKQLISLRLDKDVIGWFKSGGPNYQTKMNSVLRSFMEWNLREQKTCPDR